MTMQGVGAASSLHSAMVRHPPWREALVATLLLGGAAAAWLLSLGGLSLGWDTLNHHVYLGWIAVEGNRLQHDVFAAGSMSCQYPYAYAPLYWLQAHGANGSQAALALALPAVAAVPAVWLLCWTMWPARTTGAFVARCAWVAIAFLSPLWWSLLDSTSNDLMSTLPVVWAFALAAWCAACDLSGEGGGPSDTRSSFVSLMWFALSGALVAVALMIKISQAFSALGLLVLALASARSVGLALRRLLAMAVGGGVVALLLWWPWARAVWVACGSPIYPMLTDWFRPLVGALP